MQPVALPTLLKKIGENRYQIPQFQRPFRWKRSQIKLLVDSIARSYPIGSLLVMGRTPELNLHSRTIQAAIFEDSNNIQDNAPDKLVDAIDHSTDVSDVSYVLDGQQRLTSIARVFLNGDPDVLFYFDLKSMHEKFSANDDTNRSEWIKTRQRGSGEPDRRDKNRLVRADIALDQQRIDVYIAEFFSRGQKVG